MDAPSRPTPDRDASTRAKHRQILDKIQRRMDELGWPQTELARQTGIPYGRINKWFIPVGTLTPGDALLIARALGLPLEYLCDHEQTGPPVVLTDEDRELLNVIHQSGLSPREVVPLIIEGLRRRTQAQAQTQPATGERDPADARTATGQPLPLGGPALPPPPRRGTSVPRGRPPKGKRRNAQRFEAKP